MTSLLLSVILSVCQNPSYFLVIRHWSLVVIKNMNDEWTIKTIFRMDSDIRQNDKLHYCINNKTWYQLGIKKFRNGIKKGLLL